MTIDEIISRFLADAQYRVAEYAGEITELKKEGYTYDEQSFHRAELILWMDLLYESRMPVHDGYNLLGAWEDREIQAECEYLRKVTGMANMPYITFAGYSPYIKSEIEGGDVIPPGGSPTFPFGFVGDILVYENDGTSPVTRAFPEEGGMINETIQEYFS